MHAHERTMLSRLGFADPDRRESLHDLACGYLALPETVSRLVGLLGLNQPPSAVRDRVYGKQCVATMSKAVASHEVNLEWEIAKGYGEYRTTIGFADLMLRFYVEKRYSNVRVNRGDQSSRCGRFRRPDWQSSEDYACGDTLNYGVEVKITRVPLGDLIRQIKLYRSYSGVDRWAAVTAYPLVASDIDCLRNEGIEHLRLGKAFDEYVDAQSQATPVLDNPEI